MHGIRTCCDVAADGAVDEGRVLPRLSADADDLPMLQPAAASCSCPDLLRHFGLELLLAALLPSGVLRAAVPWLAELFELPLLCCAAMPLVHGSCIMRPVAAPGVPAAKEQWTAIAVVLWLTLLVADIWSAEPDLQQV